MDSVASWWSHPSWTRAEGLILGVFFARKIAALVALDGRWMMDSTQAAATNYLSFFVGVEPDATTAAGGSGNVLVVVHVMTFLHHLVILGGGSSHVAVVRIISRMSIASKATTIDQQDYEEDLSRGNDKHLASAIGDFSPSYLGLPNHAPS